MSFSRISTQISTKFCTHCNVKQGTLKQGSETDKAALKKALLENVEKLDKLVKNTDVLASTPSGAVSRRIEDAKRWATHGDSLSSEAKANFSDLLTTSRAVANATGGKEGAMIEKSCGKIEELLSEAGRLELEIGVLNILHFL